MAGFLLFRYANVPIKAAGIIQRMVKYFGWGSYDGDR